MLQPLVLPFLLGLVIALAAGRLVIPLLARLKARQAISTDAPGRHAAKAGTPTMGGLLILAGGLAPPLLLVYPTAVPGLVPAVLLCALAYGAIGFLDDYLIVRRGKNLGLRAREKLALQIAVAGLFVGWVYLFTPSPGWTGGSAWLRLPLALAQVVLLVGMSNAVNLTDGLDGLASGVSLPVWLTLGVAGAFPTLVRLPAAGGVIEYGVVAVCAAFAGATVGYLWYNAHPAQVFMGDTGSLAVGGGLAAAAIALGLEWPLLIAGAVHVAEAGSVTAQVISFKTTGRRIFRMSPLHHHFELCDWPETRIVARFSIASVFFCGLALALAFWRG